MAADKTNKRGALLIPAGGIAQAVDSGGKLRDGSAMA